MKPEQIYEELINLAEKLEITVSEQNLRKTGVKAKSGLCKVKGNYLFIMDKHKSIHKKIDLLSEHLAAIHNENIYIIPAVRELLAKAAKSTKK
jgi:hypothetical protein